MRIAVDIFVSQITLLQGVGKLNTKMCKLFSQISGSNLFIFLTCRTNCILHEKNVQPLDDVFHYRSCTANLNTVKSKFHLIQTFC